MHHRGLAVLRAVADGPRKAFGAFTRDAREIALTISSLAAAGTVGLLIAGTLGVPVSEALAPTLIQPYDGFAYSVAIPEPRFLSALFELTSDSPQSPTESQLSLFENANPLGPGHALHAEVRELGAGRFSHWQGGLIFSATDNTDPRSNGRRYAYRHLAVLRSSSAAALIALALGLLATSCTLSHQCRSALRHFHGSALPNLWQVSRLLVIESAPVLGVTAILIAVAFAVVAAVPQPELLRAAYTDTARAVILEQVLRADKASHPDVLFVGDSACLMGIDPTYPPLVATAASWQSLCTIGYVGPSGYGTLIKRFLAAGGSASRIVIAMNPVSLPRDPGWEQWATFAGNGAEQYFGDTPAPDGFDRVASVIERRWISALIFRADSGTLGLYYGNARGAAHHVADSGSIIDPTVGLAGPTPPTVSTFDIVKCNRKAWESGPNATLEAALVPLADLIARHKEIAFSLAIMPMPEGCLNSEDPARLLSWYERIAAQLGLPTETADLGVVSLPDRFFSTIAHVNRFGRAVLTDTLMRQLAATAHSRPSGDGQPAK